MRKRVHYPVLQFLAFLILNVFMMTVLQAGVAEDQIRQYTGLDRTPVVVISEAGIKRGIKAAGQRLVIHGRERLEVALNTPDVLTRMDPLAQIGFGYVMQGGLVVLTTYDLAMSAEELSSWEQYRGPETGGSGVWTTPGMWTDKLLHLGDFGTGVFLVIGTGGAALAGLGAISAAPVAAGTLVTAGGIRLGIKIVRAVHQDDLLPRAGRMITEILNGLPTKNPPFKLPPNCIYDLMGIMGSNVPGSFGRPGIVVLDEMGYGTWIPLDQFTVDQYGNLSDPFDLTGRIPYENGVEGARQPVADPSKTGAQVYKPNIYLYSLKDREVAVTLPYASLITASDPPYLSGKGWQASIRNGSLNGCEDFLFYEAAVQDIGFQKTEGWRVRSRWLASDMASILDRYGFSPKEKEDFLEYWAEKLEKGMDYIFYPQETAIVDKVMPLCCEPAMQHNHRIWFFIRPDQGQSLAEPAAVEVIGAREDTLVEWGGILE